MSHYRFCFFLSHNKVAVQSLLRNKQQPAQHYWCACHPWVSQQHHLSLPFCLSSMKDPTSHLCSGIAPISQTCTHTHKLEALGCSGHTIRAHLLSEEEDVDHATPHTYRTTVTLDLHALLPLSPGLPHPTDELMHYSPEVDVWTFVLREGSIHNPKKKNFVPMQRRWLQQPHPTDSTFCYVYVWT